MPLPLDSGLLTAHFDTSRRTFMAGSSKEHRSSSRSPPSGLELISIEPPPQRFRAF
jgi:hypothetical protein